MQEYVIIGLAMEDIKKGGIVIIKVETNESYPIRATVKQARFGRVQDKIINNIENEATNKSREHAQE